MDTSIVTLDERTFSVEDGFVRFFILLGEEKALVIDSGASGPDVKKIAKELTNLPIMMLNTHGDGDHTSGNKAFSEFYIHPADYESREMKDLFPDSKMLPIKDGDVIELGNRPLRVIEIPGHTAGSVAILDCVNRRLFAGDSVQKGHIYMFGDHRRPEQFEESLQKLIALHDEYDQVIASHDEAVLPADSVSKVLADWKRVLAGEVAAKKIDLWGNQVDSYDADYCGFYK